MNRRPLSLAALVLTVTLAAALVPAGAPARTARLSLSPARAFAPHRLVLKFRGQRFGRAVGLPQDVGVRRAAAALRRDPRVVYAAPDYLATASAKVSAAAAPEIPNDSGSLTELDTPGGWVAKQWNFLPWSGSGTPELPTSPGGIDVVRAWQNLIEARHPGGEGVTVAVLDTGVAYRSAGTHFLRSPDFEATQFVRGYDFVSNDFSPLDQNGHGTHVAGTIAEQTGNGIGLTGIAYGAKLMPVRVLDSDGVGRASAIARGIRFAVRHGADVVNMSFNFDCGQHVPEVNEQLRRAFRAGVVVVASIGNLGSEACISPPATGPHVIGVGGTTEGGCLGKYSLSGRRIDLLAPGGGIPASGCPSVLSGTIYQVTFESGNPAEFGEPGGYVGTSMAAAHVSGVAALVLASRVSKPPPSAPPMSTVTWLQARLRSTARSLGLPASQQGAGLIDAGLATDPRF